MRIRLSEAELDRFDAQMQRVGAVGGERGEVAVAENAKRDERGNPLAVGRNLVEARPSITRADGLDPLR